MCDSQVTWQVASFAEQNSFDLDKFGGLLSLRFKVMGNTYSPCQKHESLPQRKVYIINTIALERDIHIYPKFISYLPWTSNDPTHFSFHLHGYGHSCCRKQTPVEVRRVALHCCECEEFSPVAEVQLELLLLALWLAVCSVCLSGQLALRCKMAGTLWT
jgi:hypothetical protein